MNPALLIPHVDTGLGIVALAPRSCLAGSAAPVSTAPELMARAATTSDSFNAVAEPRRRDDLNYLGGRERAAGGIPGGPEVGQPVPSKPYRGPRTGGRGRGRP